MKVELEFSLRYADKANSVLEDVKRMYEEMYPGRFDLGQTASNVWEYRYDDNDYDFDEEYRESVEQFKDDLNWYLHGLAEIPVDEWTESLY